MKKLLLILFIPFLFTQKSMAQCEPVLTMSESFGNTFPACWTFPNGNSAIANNGTFYGSSSGTIIQTRELANLVGTFTLLITTVQNYNNSFDVDRVQNGVLISSQRINISPGGWKTFTFNFTSSPGRGYIRIVQRTGNAKGLILGSVTYTSSCPATPEVIFKTTDKTIQLDASGNATITPAQVDLGSITTCGDAITNFSFDVSTFTCADLGSNTVTLTAKDGNGNALDTTPIIVTVEDVTAPTAIGQNIAIQADGDGNATITTAMVDNGSFDGCGGSVTLSLSKTTFVCGETGDFTVILTAVDPIGNTASTEVTVTVSSSTIADQALTATNGNFCPDGSTTFPAATISTASSQVGFDYVLRKSSDNSIIDGPLTGTGSALNFNTGGLMETTAFNVFAEDAGFITNSALGFDGANDYVAVNLNPTFDYENGYTIEGWIKIAVPVNDNRPIFSIGNGSLSDIEIYVQNTTNDLVVVHDRGEATFGGYSYTVPPNNQWFHLAVTYDGTSAIKVYFNGVEQAITNSSFAPAGSLTRTAAQTMKIGKVDNTAFGAGGAVFYGLMDEFRIWTATKTGAELLADKDNCLTGSETGLEYYFNLDDNSGLSATDLVNGTDGVLTNMYVSAWAPSGTGSSCTKYVNSCGFQMLTEIKIGDNAPPTAVAQNVTVQIDGGTGLATITAAMIDNSSTDNCGGAVTLSLSKTEFGCENIGANTVALIVVDAAGNQSTANATVTVTSSINDETITSSAANFCSGGGSVDITTGSSVNGINYYLRNNTDDTIIAGPVAGTGSGLTFNSGNLTVTTTFNVYGEVASSVSNALDFDGVNDYISTSVPASFNYSSSYTMETWVKAPLPGASGGFPSPIFVGNTVGSDIEVYVQQGTNDLLVVHNRGNGGTLSYGTFPDPPNNVWYHLAIVYNGTNIEVFYDGVSQGSFAILAPLASASAFINIGYISSSAFGTANIFKGQLDDYRLWSTAKTGAEINATKSNCLVGDEAGLETYYNFDDGSGLIATDLANTNNGTLTNMNAATAWVTDVAFSCGQTCSFEMTNTVTVSVGDAVNPTVIAQDFTVQLNSDGGATITTADINNGSTDNCTDVNSLVISLDKTVFTCSDLGANTVILTVEDASGNQGTAMATVTVVDDILPTALAKAFTAQLDATGNVVITPADVNNGSADNCTAVNSLVLSLDKTAFSCADLGANTVTLTVTDASNNQSTATATVTVVDDIVPTAVAQNITVQLDATGNVTVAAIDVDNGSSDNCSSGASLLLSLSQSTFDCTNLGANTITLTVEDASGNQFSAGATVTVEDNIAPTVVTRDIVVGLGDNTSVSIATQNIDAGSTDACGTLSYSLDKDTFTITDLGTNTVILTVSDGNGNSATGTAVVTVTEKQNQTITFNTLADKTYGDAGVTLSASSSASLSVGFSVVSGPATLSGSTLSFTGVGNVVIEATQVGNNDFVPAAPVQRSFAIAQAVLTVTADDQSITYGDAIPTLTFSYAGFVNSEESSVLSSEPTAASVATLSSDAGNYAVTLTGGSADNYALTLVDGSLTIDKADQTITLDAIAGQDFTQVSQVTVTSSTSSSLAVNLTVSGPATISGNVITLDGTSGTITVTATQAGSTNYNAATEVTTSFNAFDGTDPCLSFAVTLTSVTNNTCNGAAEGELDITVTGGDGTYSFDWSNDTSAEDLTNVTAGTYTVTVTDGNNCSVTLSETITEPTSIDITVTTTDVVVGNDGVADITVTGGTGAYTFSWDNGATTEDLSNVAAGTYTVTVTDANGCSASRSIEVGDIITALKDVATTEVSVYPNPVSDFVKVEGAFANAKVEVQIINSLGVQVLIKRFEDLNSNTIELPVTDLKNGHYLVVITSDNTQTVQRINIKH